MRLFSRDADYEAFERLIHEACAKFPMRVLAYCLMPTHWHLVLWPENDVDLSKFMFWLTMTHAQRWRHKRKLVGLGPLYQGRFRAFPVEADGHLLIVLRYSERNPLRAKLVTRAEHWRFSSLHARLDRANPKRAAILHPWPIDLPEDWLELVNTPQTDAEVEAMRISIQRGRPFGDPKWQARIAKQLNLVSCFRPKGRPGKSKRVSK